jgi:hypothetical protein
MLDKTIGQINNGKVYYKIHKDAIMLADLFYDKHLRGSHFLNAAKRFLKTDKYRCHIQKNLAMHFFDMLNDINLLNESPDAPKEVLMLDLHPNRFFIEEVCKNKTNLNIRWIGSELFFAFLFAGYLGYLLIKIFKSGFVLRKPEDIKMYKEAVWGLGKTYTRDDLLIDNLHFNNNDVIFYTRANIFKKSPYRLEAKLQLEQAGYTVVDMSKMAINLKRGASAFLKLYVYMILYVMCRYKIYQLEDMIHFNLSAYGHFVFLTNYNAKLHHSNSVGSEIAGTIMMNFWGCKNFVYHLSDMTVLQTVNHAYHAHNIFYSWGDIHRDFDSGHYFHDKIVNVGCIFRDALENLDIPSTKTILACDSSFVNTFNQTEDFYLDYLDLLHIIAAEIQDARFIFKAKHFDFKTIADGFSGQRKKSFLDKISILKGTTRFDFYYSNVQLESLFPKADVIISLGINSPSTIALLCGKEALYYDTSGNDQHPFSKYKNQIVFDDKEKLLSAVKKILNKEMTVFDYIDDKLLSSFGCFRDDKALQRLIEAVHLELQQRVPD